MPKKSRNVIAVDLDRTLLKSDMLHETFWSAFSLKWHILFLSIVEIFKGKAALKDFLASNSEVDVSTLPYDEKVIDYIHKYREQGDEVVLVTASSQKLADKISEHLQIFDEAHGSDGVSNLKGKNKARFIRERFKGKSVCYIGDGFADLPIWADAEKIVTVNSSPALKRETEKLKKPVEHLKTVSKSKNQYLIALRPHQWLKNSLLFLPVLAAHNTDTTSLIKTLLGFIAFNCIASSVYIFNDLLDLNSDRAHERKCLRPFASGALPISHGPIIAFVLIFFGIGISANLGVNFFIIISFYLLLTTAYSLVIKSIVVLDICVLAGLYTIRILAGGAVASTEISVWLLAFSAFFFLSLAAIKRQAELVSMTKFNNHKVKGRGYNAEDLIIVSVISLVSGYISVLVMALYINSPKVQNLYSSPHALWGICCVLLYWITRAVILTHRGKMHYDPVVFVTKDLVSQICFIIMLIFASLGVFL